MRSTEKSAWILILHNRGGKTNKRAVNTFFVKLKRRKNACKQYAVYLVYIGIKIELKMKKYKGRNMTMGCFLY